MDDRVTQRKNAKEFIKIWKGYEKGEAQAFWISLLRDVLGVSQTNRIMEFEKKVVVGGQTNYIDAYIKPPMKILIEQKGSKIDLRKKYKQSDGATLTPFEQAKRYASELGENLYPNYIVVCNFEEMHIHDIRNGTNTPPVVIKLEDLPDQIQRLAFLADADKELTAFEQKISVEAGEIVGQIYDALLEQYQDKTNPESLKSLNKLCVRLVFCLYAEDSGLFSTHLEFHDYLRKYSADARTALIQLFKILNTPEVERDRYLAKDLLAFPYVNGGLFADEDIEIPWITPQIVELILKKASEGFDWSRISPTIFGAVFESTLNPETRRKGGMHYTSVENIHKVIDPLFLDELKDELKKALDLKVPGTRNKRLEAFRKKLGSLTFLDPACGSGNFLTETYKCLRELENEALREIYQGQMALGEDLSPIEVHINQFYGIEINDFAVTVARTALWIAESQMMKETEDIVGGDKVKFLPLKSSAHIHEANALTMDWNNVIPAMELNYIMGNPPFLGSSMMDARQKKEIVSLFKNARLTSSIDYVSGWYIKAAEMMQQRTIECAFVSTNSITQGEQVFPIWNPLINKFGMNITFAHQTFKWMSDSTETAAVYCVIIGFSYYPRQKPCLYTYEKVTSKYEKSQVSNISPYLTTQKNILVSSVSKPIFTDKTLTKGNQPTDNGNFILSQEEKDEILTKTPELKPYIRRYLGAKDFLHQSKENPRFCLWLRDAPTHLIKKNKEVSRRLEAIKLFRSKSTAKPTREKADSPEQFFSNPQKDRPFIVIPRVSSEKREYIPIGFMPKEVIAADSLSIVTNGDLLLFAFLTSKVHMVWMRAVSGRLEMRYRYSGAMTYNTFPFLQNVSQKDREHIETLAKRILEARESEKNKGTDLADLYTGTLPTDLRKAHQDLDKAILKLYSLSSKATNHEILAKLLDQYEEAIKRQEKGAKSTVERND